MTRHPSPIDAKAAKKMLRFYVIAIPASTLLGGWCALLMLVWITFPAVVDHMPVAVKTAASAIAAGWLYWLFRTFKKLPSLIDDILERGLSLSLDPTAGSGNWLERTGQQD